MTSLHRILLLGSLLVGPAISLPARNERIVEKTFEVSGAGTLWLQTQGGSIRVSPSNDGAVRITARQKIRTRALGDADAMLEKLELDFRQDGNDVHATANYPGRKPGLHLGSWPPVSVDFVVTVPAAFATELRTSGGGIEVGDLTGRVNARTSGGSIKLGRMGGEVQAHTSGGGISLAEAHGPVKLGTSGGSIKVGRVAVGPADLSTSGGSIRLDFVEGAVRARTSGGGVRVGLVGGLREDCVLSTSGGGVDVTVERTAGFQLDASTSGGGVNASGLDLEPEGFESSRSRLRGRVNGGGPNLKLRSSGGSISIRVN